MFYDRLAALSAVPREGVIAVVLAMAVMDAKAAAKPARKKATA